MLLIAVCAMSQITLENTYNYSASVTELNDEDYYYYLMDVPASQCRIYTSSHVLYKTIYLSIPDGYYLSDVKFVGTNLFNSDALIELLYIYEKYVPTESSYYFQYGLSVINEDGYSLLNLPNGGWAELNKIKNEHRLLAYSYIYNPAGYYEVTTNVYKIGQTTLNSKISQASEYYAFPNPASQAITIYSSEENSLNEAELNIYDSSGIKVKQQIYRGNGSKVQVDDLPAGLYHYTLKEGNKLIASKKIIIR
jgi:hypothetical protein